MGNQDVEYGTEASEDAGARQLKETSIGAKMRDPKKIIESVRDGDSISKEDLTIFLDMLKRGEAESHQAIALWAFLKCKKDSNAGLLQARIFQQNERLGIIIAELAAESSDSKISNSIARKLKGEPFNAGEIEKFISGIKSKESSDELAAAFLVASYCYKLSPEETQELTLAMAKSGDTLDFLNDPLVVDKHSSGGVGDKLTLTVLPLAAAMGLKVGKMSGRGLGHTGGTVDKLESIPGYNTEIDKDTFLERLNSLGMVLVGSSTELAPADKKLYALRDVTGTVPSIQLIAASIMSKKIAGGAKFIVLDVKYGAGAFMPTAEEAEKLGTEMQKIGEGLGRKVSVLISSMEAPLGQAVGNATEVLESIEVLKGSGDRDIRHLTATLAAMMEFTAGRSESFKASHIKALDILDSGAAYQKFEELVENHGGDVTKLNPEGLGLLDPDIIEVEILAKETGFIQKIDPLKIAYAVNSRGAGRKTSDEKIDPRIGFLTLPKIGDKVEVGQVIAKAYIKKSQDEAAFIADTLDALTVASSTDTLPTDRDKLVHDMHLAEA